MTHIIYQGDPGSYHHQVCLEIQKNLDRKINGLIGYDTFKECWEDIENNILVLAIENSTIGNIHENLYNFYGYDPEIIGESYLNINHCICSLENEIEKVNTVYSHRAALPQCSKYLNEQSIIHQIVHADTAGAAKMISEKEMNGCAAICSELAADIYGLNILAKNIQNNKNNATRFLIVKEKGFQCNYLKNSNKTTLLFTTKNIAGSLYNCLGVFVKHKINLTKIESLSHLASEGQSLFWLDVEGDIEKVQLKNAIKDLEDSTVSIKILGSY